MNTVDPLTAAAEAYQRARDLEAAAKKKAERARQAVTAARKEAERQREVLAEAIVAAARAGHGNAEIRRVTGYHRERIRQICRAAGVEPAE